jgi:hypothetical protein
MLFQRRPAEHWRALLASLDATLPTDRTIRSISPRSDEMDARSLFAAARRSWTAPQAAAFKKLAPHLTTVLNKAWTF